MHAHMARLARENHYDVIQVEGIEMAPYAAGAARASGPPASLVFDDHNAEYVLQKRAFLTDVRQPRRWLGAAYSFVQWQKLIALRAAHLPDGRSRRRRLGGRSRGAADDCCRVST